MTISATEPTYGLSAAVAAEIRAWMGRRAVRQSQLARSLGENEQWLSTRLRGTTPLNLNDVGRIADALNVRVIDLLPQRHREVTVTSAHLEPRRLPDRPRGRHDPARPGTRGGPPAGPGRTARTPRSLAA